MHYAGSYAPRHRHGPVRVFVPGGPGYGPEPVTYPGMGGALPSGGFMVSEPLPVAVTLYREAYIGRGLIYNVPPLPGFASQPVISARY